MFLEVQQLPWSLFTISDRDRVVDILEGMTEEAEDPVVRQLQALHRLGLGRDKLKDVLLACSSVSFSSACCEKQHVSTSVLQKRHDLGRESLTSRALIHFARSALKNITKFMYSLNCIL
eukprot:6492283-Amphidinium_carterae.2